MKMVMAAIVLALCAAPALAQKKMYRCGSQYQDRPCDAPKEAPTAARQAEAPQRPVSEERREAQKRIRCENYARQREELGRKQAESARQVAEGMSAQISALDKRIREEGC